MHYSGWVWPKAPRMDGPVKTVCREEASWEEKEAGLGWGTGQRPGEKEEAQVVSRLEYGEKAVHFFLFFIIFFFLETGFV